MFLRVNRVSLVLFAATLLACVETEQARVNLADGNEYRFSVEGTLVTSIEGPAEGPCGVPDLPQKNEFIVAVRKTGTTDALTVSFLKDCSLQGRIDGDPGSVVVNGAPCEADSADPAPTVRSTKSFFNIFRIDDSGMVTSQGFHEWPKDSGERVKGCFSLEGRVRSLVIVPKVGGTK